jgi:hypothetical protein
LRGISRSLNLFYSIEHFGSVNRLQNQTQKVGNKKSGKFGFRDNSVCPVSRIKNEKEDQEFKHTPAHIEKANLVLELFSQGKEDKKNS